MSDASRAVFLSYASQDAEAAKRICEALRAAGVEVWFDQSELVGGDQWDAKIRGQIGSCALFIPVISANTQARLEGYFRLEWKLAAQRTHTMADEKAFLLPILVDGTRDAEAKVPAEFKAVQWTKLPGGETPTAFVARVGRLLAGETVSAPPRSPPEARAVRRKNSPWFTAAIVVLPLLTGLILAWWVVPGGRRASLSSAAALTPPTANPAPAAAAPPALSPANDLSAARKLVAQARALFEGDELQREDFALAEDLLAKAQMLDATDGEVWAARAELSHDVVVVGIDLSSARRENLRIQSERAIKLAPDSIEAQLAYAGYQQITGGESAAEALRLLQSLVERAPRHHRAYRLLAFSLMTLGRLDEGVVLLDRANALPGGDPFALLMKGVALFLFGRYDEADAAIAQSLTLRPTGRARVMDTLVKLAWRGDLDGAVASLARWPAPMTLEPRGAFVASQVWLWHHQPDKAIEVLQAFTSDSINDLFFNGPRSGLLALAYEMAGRSEAARAEWENTKNSAAHALAENHAQPSLLAWKGVALARLGESAEAESILRQLEQTAGLASAFWSCGAPAALLRIAVNRGGEVATKFDSEGRTEVGKVVNVPSPQAALRLNPVFDPIRATPEFQKWLAAAPAPETKKAGGATAPNAVAPDQKSVAVLAFANLSDDKGNEYFSDGISEELLNVLAKIPDLKVAARTSAFYFKGKEVPVPEIARQLGVAYVVEGSVRKAGDKVRITAQLIKAADGFHVWSDTFTRDLKDIFAVQDEIAGLIAKNLEVKMGIAAARPTIDLEAYQEYLAGRALFAKAGNGDLQEAVRSFEKAVAIEPRFTAAWVQLASAHTQLGRWGGAPTLQSWAAARAAIDRARALEPDSPEVQLALGWILRTADWDWRGAAQAFRRALQLRPNQPDALAGLAVLQFNLGQKEEAFRLGQQAARLDPLNPATQIDLSLMFYLNNNLAEAERSARRALQLAPGGAGYHCILAWSLIKQGRLGEAETEAGRDSDVIEKPLTYGLLALARGQGAVAREKLAELEEISRTNNNLADLQNSIAWISVGLGEKDRPFAALEKARDSRDPSNSWLRSSPYLDPLHSDPRWNALLHQVGLADDQLP